jgi:hypothetical protein
MTRVSRVRARVVSVVLVLASGCAADATTRIEAEPTSERRVGEWTFFRFGGGPPAPGQITDTVTVDVDTRAVTLSREHAGEPTKFTCAGVATDSERWRELAELLGSSAADAVIAHPDRLPRLMIDMGYFHATHAGVSVAVSDARREDEGDEAETLRKVQSLYGVLLADVLALPACKDAPG